MASRKRKKSQTNKRQPFWERLLAWKLSALKRLALPALAIWLITWLAIGGVFERTRDYVWNEFVELTAEQGLVVKDVVINGRNRTDLKALQKAVAVDLNDPVLSVDIDEIHANIQAMPWVKNVTVARNFNGIIRIDLTERIPFVIWDRPGRGMSVVDTDGKVIEGVGTQNFESLLIVRGVGAPKFTVDLMRLVLAEPTIAQKVRAAEWIGDRRWDLIMVTGMRVHLPEEDAGLALARLSKIQGEKNILDRDLLSVDLRGSDRIIVETERGRSQDVMNLSSATELNTI
jgi:cell division protein FtsQ